MVSVPLVANTRDITHREGESLLDAGFVGAYHAVRLGEGSDTLFKKEKRIQTIQVLNAVGLLWMNCHDQSVRLRTGRLSIWIVDSSKKQLGKQQRDVR